MVLGTWSLNPSPQSITLSCGPELIQGDLSGVELAPESSLVVFEVRDFSLNCREIRKIEAVKLLQENNFSRSEFSPEAFRFLEESDVLFFLQSDEEKKQLFPVLILSPQKVEEVLSPVNNR
jgi:hypothetical protein